MSEILAMWVPGMPESKGSFVGLGGGRVKNDNPREKAWADAIGWMARVQLRSRQPVSERVIVLADFWLLPPKGRQHQRDLDKAVRSALDALTGLAYRDDVLVKRIETEKYLVGEESESEEGFRPTEPGLRIRVRLWSSKRTNGGTE